MRCAGTAGLYIGFGGACTFQGAKRAAKSRCRPAAGSHRAGDGLPLYGPGAGARHPLRQQLIRYVGEYIAQLKGISVEEVFRTTAENARRVYGL